MPAPGSGCSSVNDAPGHGGASIICVARHVDEAQYGSANGCPGLLHERGVVVVLPGRRVRVAGHAADGTPGPARSSGT